MANDFEPFSDAAGGPTMRELRFYAGPAVVLLVGASFSKVPESERFWFGVLLDGADSSDTLTRELRNSQVLRGDVTWSETLIPGQLLFKIKGSEIQRSLRLIADWAR